MGRLPESWLRELYERVDLRQLIGSYVQLQEKGGRLWGCCPFHHEKDPSFTVNVQQGFYHCFGCGQHGNAVGFVMEMERLSFREACAFLAQRVGLELPESEDGADARRDRQLADRVRSLNREAAAFYHRCLASEDGRPGSEYLDRRGVDGAIRRRFGLGFAPDAWHRLRDHLRARGFSDGEQSAAGLVQEKNGSRYDAFRNRVIFPILSPRSEVIGFGGRVLDDSVPKYLNSPATPVFNKSRSLFNLHTVHALRQQGGLREVLLMEGYMDVIGAARFGVLNACATLGTALTPEQCRLISRYVNRVGICYDGDSAGVKAAMRALDLLAEAGLEARVVCLPGGMDPDEYLGRNGCEAFMGQVERALEPMAFRFRVAREGRDLSVPADRTAYAEACVGLLRQEKSALVRQQYAEVLQRETGFRLDAILDDVSQAGQRAPAAPAAVRPAVTGGAWAKAENFVTAVMAGRPDLAAALVLILKERDFDHPVNAAVYRYVRDNAGRGAEISAAELEEMLESAEARGHLRWLLGGLNRYSDDAAGLQSMLTGCVAKLGARRTQRDMQLLQAELDRTTDPEETERKRRQMQKLGQRLLEWKQQASASPDRRAGQNSNSRR